MPARLFALVAALGLGCAVAFGEAGTAVRDASACPGERERARRLAAELNETWPIRNNDPVTALVRDLGERVAKAAPRLPYPWRFTVVRHRTANAFSIGEGRIYVHDGSIRQVRSESELAALIAHEMSHQLRGHFCPQSPRAGAPANSKQHKVGSVYQRIDPAKEIEADKTALEMLDIAGFDPHATLRMARRVRRKEHRDSGHYQIVDRMKVLQRLLTRYPKVTVTNSEAFHRAKRELAGD